jgi:hypothetical protein
VRNYFNLVEISIKHWIEKENGVEVGYSLEVHFSNEASKTLKFLPII